jgi:hypothetical protein
MLQSNDIPFIVIGAICWLLVLKFADYKQLKRNIWLGVIAYIMGVVVDYSAYRTGLYTMYLHNLRGLIALLISKLLAPLPIGILYAQYMPKNRSKQLLSIIILDIGYLLVEVFLVKFGTLVHFRWNLRESVIYNVFIFATLTYINKTFINSGKYRN